MWLLAGLGNPGPEHRLQRHNVGFMALDRIVARYFPLGNWRARFGGLAMEFTIDPSPALRERVASEASRVRVVALKPQGFMNVSGESLHQAASFYKIPPERVVVIHDDLDLAPGRIEVKQGGGHGGHNGLRSADAHLGRDYWRLRIGIGHPAPSMADKEMKQRIVLAHVLGNFGKQDWAEVEPALDRAVEVAGELITHTNP
jgi:PTH1 family peptidyl-tRNA hydrolase